MSAPNAASGPDFRTNLSAPIVAASGEIATLVVDGEYLLIEVLEHDPEILCSRLDGRVATHRLLTPKCLPHPLCIEHAEAQARWLSEQSMLPDLWYCDVHRVSWLGTRVDVKIEPLQWT